MFWLERWPYYHVFFFFMLVAKLNPQWCCSFVYILRQQKAVALPAPMCRRELSCPSPTGELLWPEIHPAKQNGLAQILLPLCTAVTHPYLQDHLRSTSASCTPLVSGAAGTVWHCQQKTQLHTINLGKDLLSCTKILFVARNWKGLDHILLYAIWEKEKNNNNNNEQLITALTNTTNLQPIYGFS